MVAIGNNIIMKIAFVLAGWGSWVKPLIKELSQFSDINVYAITTGRDKPADCACKVYSLNLTSQETKGCMSKSTFRKYEKVINEITPDIIQVFGTENNFGQIASYIDNIPVVVHLQGILTNCSYFRECYLHLKEMKKYRSLKNYFGYGGLVIEKQVMYNEKSELDILKNNRYFFGRTKWDYYTLFFNNGNALYFQNEELLREVFYDNSGSWNINEINRHSIFMPSGFSPVKGLHIAIEAIRLLKRDYPDIKLYVPGLDSRYLYGSKFWRYIRGECFTNYLADKVQKYKLHDHVILVGTLDAVGMKDYMKRSHIFLSPSVIDNSPNAVGEATMIGVPVVSTYVGGVPSFLEDGKTCLFANSGDPYMIAAAIKTIFDNDKLALKLSNNALQVAKRRHDKMKVAYQCIENFQKVITDFNTRRADTVNSGSNAF